MRSLPLHSSWTLPLGPATLQLVPSSGSKSVSLWDVREPEELKQWLDEVRNTPCSTHICDLSGAAGCCDRRSVHARQPPCPFLFRAMQTVNVDVTHEVFEVQVRSSCRRCKAAMPACASCADGLLPLPAASRPSCQQEEFAIGLGEVARARAAEKVRFGCWAALAPRQAQVRNNRLCRGVSASSSNRNCSWQPQLPRISCLFKEPTLFIKCRWWVAPRRSRRRLGVRWAWQLPLWARRSVARRTARRARLSSLLILRLPHLHGISCHCWPLD